MNIINNLKKIFLTKPNLLVVLVVFLVFLLFGLYQNSLYKISQKNLREVRNQLSEAVGTIEISEGVYQRQVQEYNNLNRRVDDLLGENSRLNGVIGDRDSRIRTLMQLNANLAESLRFSSYNEGSNSTTTVIDSNCLERRQNNTNLQNNQSITTQQDLDSDDFIQNLRVDFNLLSQGFRAIGYTTTNPSYAEIELTQIEPFVIDVAIVRNRENIQSVVVSEQSGRLQLDVGQFAISTREYNRRFVELLGFGTNVTAINNSYVTTANVYVEGRRRFDAYAGPSYDILNNGFGAQAGLIYRPFRKNR
jgi:hypothetical protein